MGIPKRQNTGDIRATEQMNYDHVEVILCQQEQKPLIFEKL